MSRSLRNRIGRLEVRNPEGGATIWCVIAGRATPDQLRGEQARLWAEEIEPVLAAPPRPDPLARRIGEDERAVAKQPQRGRKPPPTNED